VRASREAFAALRKLGFREKEARAAIVCAQQSEDSADAQALLRKALAIATEGFVRATQVSSTANIRAD
jgi:Holliday junction resolvasome RuvABC DNA-binding subunit